MDLRFSDLLAAQQRLKGLLPVTPLSFSPPFSELLGREIYFKWDNKYRTGSFKERGASNFLLSLSDQEKKGGVCAASAGNHALALSYHAARCGVSCHIFMPVTAPLVKIEATRKTGATVTLFGNNFNEANDQALKFAAQNKLTFVPPFDHARIIAGQGTCGLEILEQLPDLDAVVVPVGGGGLISGISTAIKEKHPNVFILGAQSEWAVNFDRRQSQAGSAIPPGTIADGIAVKSLGKIPAAIIEKKVDKLVPLTEIEIATAMVQFLEQERTVIEGAGAAGLAALLAGHLPKKFKKVVVVACGSNVDINVLSRLIERDMAVRGRLLKLVLAVPDRPGSLNKVSKIIAELGANVMQVYHERSFSSLPGNVDITFLLEVRSHEHTQEIVNGLHKLGIEVREDTHAPIVD